MAVIIRVSEVRRLARLQCTVAEAAAQLGIRPKTFRQIVEKDERIAAAWEDGRQIGRMNIRRKQMRLADYNAQMAIHLGKTYLEQHEVIKQQVSGEGGGPVQYYDVGKLDAKERDKLRSLLTRTARRPAAA